MHPIPSVGSVEPRTSSAKIQKQQRHQHENCDAPADPLDRIWPRLSFTEFLTNELVVVERIIRQTDAVVGGAVRPARFFARSALGTGFGAAWNIRATVGTSLWCHGLVQNQFPTVINPTSERQSVQRAVLEGFATLHAQTLQRSDAPTLQRSPPQSTHPRVFLICLQVKPHEYVIM